MEMINEADFEEAGFAEEGEEKSDLNGMDTSRMTYCEGCGQIVPIKHRSGQRGYTCRHCGFEKTFD